jgi:hypothetical protein
MVLDLQEKFLRTVTMSKVLGIIVNLGMSLYQDGGFMEYDPFPAVGTSKISTRPILPLATQKAVV